ncbi:sigma-70 family RNA polymerase sigma factor [Larkinella terrae]|uniref:Sigma-70 family RNA polymerase sigma factor n=1 Tax=Larkinella terrae TaxID=2025311 RepID=A0A7K0EDY6_9BACT|nr:sigma-70 family RNA polymerase sigma factor [Larkinella terrae]
MSVSVFFRRGKSLPLPDIIEGCRNGKQSAQKQLFEAYYSFGVNVCLRYASSREEAEEMFDDGFLRVLNKISYYDPEQPFDAWFRTVMVRSAIDHYRQHQSRMALTDLENAYDVGVIDDLFERISAEEILSLVQKIPPAYRTVFSLHVVDGYSHPEIAQLLGINEGTSRSNLAKARLKLQELLMNWTTTPSVNRRNYV